MTRATWRVTRVYGAARRLPEFGYTAIPASHPAHTLVLSESLPSLKMARDIAASVSTDSIIESWGPNAIVHVTIQRDTPNSARVIECEDTTVFYAWRAVENLPGASRFAYVRTIVERVS